MWMLFPSSTSRRRTREGVPWRQRGNSARRKATRPSCARGRPRGTAISRAREGCSAPTVGVRYCPWRGAATRAGSLGVARIRRLPPRRRAVGYSAGGTYLHRRRGVDLAAEDGRLLRYRPRDRPADRQAVPPRASAPGRNVTIWDAIRVRDQLRSEGRDRAAGTTRLSPLWSDYAVSLLEAKVAEGRLTSSKSRERWGNVLKRLSRSSAAFTSTNFARPTSSRGATRLPGGCATACLRCASATRGKASS